MSSISEQLTRLPLFSGLTPKEFDLLKQFLRSRYVEPGEPLFTEGEFGRSCYVVLAGGINVFKALRGTRQEKLATLGPGAILGHMALIDNKPRSATCRAGRERTVLIELPREAFDRLFNAKSPFAFKILDKVAMDLALRLRSATEQLTQASQERDASRRSDQARLAAVALQGYDTSDIDLDDIDLDAITFEIPEMSQRMLSVN